MREYSDLNDKEKLSTLKHDKYNLNSESQVSKVY